MGDIIHDQQKKVTVLVTGFGAFRQFKRNPSWLICEGLPSEITSKSTNTRIEIIKSQQPVRVAYNYIADTIPPLLDGVKPDIVLHMGLAAGRSFWSFELQAPRGSYEIFPDEDGNKFSPEEIRRVCSEGPDWLSPTFDCADAFDRWEKAVGRAVPAATCKTSRDPGTFGCGFIYYISLSQYLKKGPKAERPVMFLHVPTADTDAEIVDGVKIATELIRALVDSRELAHQSTTDTDTIMRRNHVLHESVGDDPNAGMQT